jgi:hypothetical protein
VNGVPIVEAGVFRIVRAANLLEGGDAGIVDDDIDAAALAAELLGDAPPLRLLANIETAIGGGRPSDTASVEPAASSMSVTSTRAPRPRTPARSQRRCRAPRR